MAVMYINDGAGKVPKSFMKQVIDGYNKTIYYNENDKALEKKITESYTLPKSSNDNKNGGIGLVLALAGALIVVSIVKR